MLGFSSTLRHKSYSVVGMVILSQMFTDDHDLYKATVLLE